jgi:hypothetical protein
MTYVWYREVTSADSISQGDILEDLPVLTFRDEVAEAADLEVMKRGLQNAAGVRAVRAVVMTQACDIEQGKVRYLHLCPAFTLAEFKDDWKRTLVAQSQNPTDKAWRNTCEQIRTGRVWNYTMLNERVADADGLSQEFLIVDFHEVFSLPIGFLRSWVRVRGAKRLQLCPPYREHLSQSFARYFMRVGLPVDIRPPT